MSVGVTLLRLISALGLIALNGFFVAVEFAVVAVRRTRLDQLVADGNANARVASMLVNNPDKVIAASQLGITMASLALGWIGEATVAALLLPAFEAALGRWSVAVAHTVATAVAFALVTLLHIVLGEQVPKTVAIRSAERTAVTIARPMDWFIRLFRPLVTILDGATALVLRLVRVQPMSGHRIVYTLDELKLIVRESQESGAIEANQEEMLQKVFLFGDRQVYEAMIPRPEVVGIDAEATVRDLIALFAQASHARFPVYEEEPDNIVGVVAIKDVLRVLGQRPDQFDSPVRLLARPPLFVPETAAVADLFAEMRATHNQMAIVLDEYGGTAGIVTLEGLVEEIVGRLSDELVALEEPVTRIDENTVEVNAQLRVDEFNERLGLDLPEGEEYETVAGFLLYQMQRVPTVGDKLRHGTLSFEVTQMKGRKIEKVRLQASG
jgi:CBS domain containing-hemolysin-like protein